jgi:hypothetical protein
LTTSPASDKIKISETEEVSLRESKMSGLRNAFALFFLRGKSDKLAVPFLIFLAVCLFPPQTDAKYRGGTGESDDPYQIGTAEDLMLLGDSPEDYEKNFILTADIDLDPNIPGRKVFDKAIIAPTPSFMGGTPFTGIFDGNGHTISHLTIRGKDYMGIIGHLSSHAIISNLGLEEVDIKKNTEADEISHEVGGLVGCNEKGIISNSYITGIVDGKFTVGGLVGYNNGRIINCCSTCMVSGEFDVGGLTGHNIDSVSNCYSTGKVSGVENIGGLVGVNRVVLSNEIVIGRGSITNSYSIGRVDGEDNIGGLTGSNEGMIISSFWNIETSGHTSGTDGKGLNTTQMQDINTYLNAGWDFVNESLNGTCGYWQISPGEYPKLHFKGDRPTMPKGLGIEEEPYQIRDAADMGTLWYEPTAHYKLENPIDLSGITWSTAPIPWFDGHFDGNGHTIHHLHIQGGDYLGLFGQLYPRGVVSNLGLEETDINGTSNDVGGIIGNNEGGVANCYSIGKVRGAGRVGGLAGFNYGSIINSYSTGPVNGSDYVGGLAGYNYGMIINSYRTDSVTGSRFVGAITGLNHPIIQSLNIVNYQIGHIIKSYSTSNISGDKEAYGLAGNNGGIIISSFWGMGTYGVADSNRLTPAIMKDINTYLNAGWDFEGESQNGICDYWQISPGEYPTLRLANKRPVMPEGSGTAEQPYLIRDLKNMGTIWSEPTAHYRLENPVDLSGITWSTAVIPWFGGSFDGNGHMIRNLDIQGHSYLGLFGQLNPGAVVSNLGLVLVNIYADSYEEKSINIGGLVGYNEGLITNNHTIGTVVGDKSVGGLVGCNNGDIINNYSAGMINGSGQVGGLAGYNGGYITDSYSAGMVSGIFTNDSVGGLVGTNAGNATNSYSTGKVIGDMCVGGLIGRNIGRITNTYSNSKVRGDSAVGGLVGANYDSITNSYSSGKVESTGIFGEDSLVGGLVGMNWTYGRIGGLVDTERDGIIISSLWDTETSEQTTSDGGEGLTTARMQDIDTYLNAGWDFVDESLNGTFDYWQISPGEYPELCIADNRPVIPEGSGTKEEPYLIHDTEDLKTIWYEPTAHYRLEASIDLSDITWTTAIIPWFGGYLDGNGHTIRNLHIQGGSKLGPVRILDYEAVGLIKKLDYDAVICNLGLEQVDVNGTDSYVGSLVGVNDGTIINCYSTGKVHGYDYVGGLIGHNNGNIINSNSTCTVNGDAYIGGLIGENCGSIINSYSISTVTGSSLVGGLAGENWEGNIINCYSASNVSGGLAGGLVGESGPGVVENSFWDVETSNRTFSFWTAGTGKTTAEMQKAGTFIEAGWDFVDEIENGTEDIWWINEGQYYPKLWWQFGQMSAFSPNPQNGIKELIQPIILSWKSVESSISHDVYLGQDAKAVTLAKIESGSVYRGRLPAHETFYEPGRLEFATTYYWRIDEVNETDPNKPCKGDIWSFTTATPVSHPDPEDNGTSNVNSTVLSWVPGSTVLHYDLYFGEDEEAVGNATPESINVYVGRRVSEMTSFEPDNLEPNKTYYWRVDAVDPINPSNIWKGDVWKFTTISRSRIIID